MAESRALFEYVMRGREGRVCACPVLVFCNKSDLALEDSSAQATKMVAGVCAGGAAAGVDSLPWPRVLVLAGSAVRQKVTRACAVGAALGDGALHPEGMQYELRAEIERWLREQVRLCV